MHSRRQMMLAGAGLALAGGPVAAQTGHPSRAGTQQLLEKPLSQFQKFWAPSSGPSPTFIDAAVGQTGVVDAIVSRDGLCAAVFDMAGVEIANVYRDAAESGMSMRSLARCGGLDRYMALFQIGGQRPSTEWSLADTAAGYQARVNSAVKRGLEPVWLSIDNIQGEPRFTSLYRRTVGAWEARHNVKPSELTPLTKAMQAKGFRVARAVPYFSGGELRFASLFRPAGPHGWQAWVGDEDPLVKHRQFEAQGYSMLQATSYTVAGKRRWSCVWQRAVGARQDLTWGN